MSDNLTTEISELMQLRDRVEMLRAENERIYRANTSYGLQVIEWKRDYRAAITALRELDTLTRSQSDRISRKCVRIICDVLDQAKKRGL